MRLLSRLCIALLGIGCGPTLLWADTPAPAEPNAAAAPAAEAAAADSAGKKTPLEMAFDRAAKEYKVTEKDGRELYCRKEMPLGSRLPKTVCLSKDQLMDTVIAMQQARDSLAVGKASPCGNGKAAC